MIDDRANPCLSGDACEGLCRGVVGEVHPGCCVPVKRRGAQVDRAGAYIGAKCGVCYRFDVVDILGILQEFPSPISLKSETFSPDRFRILAGMTKGLSQKVHCSAPDTSVMILFDFQYWLD